MKASLVFRIDGVLSFVFGAVTMALQGAVFNTAVDLKSAGFVEGGGTLIESALYVISGYYMLVGAILLLLANVPVYFARRLALLVGLHHVFMAVKGFYEADRVWMVGNPWYDIVIHSVFFIAYVVIFIRSWNPAPN